MHKLLQQFARQPLPKGDLTMADMMHAIADRFQHLPLYFLTFHGGSDVDQVLEAMDYAGTLTLGRQSVVCIIQFCSCSSFDIGKQCTLTT